MTVWLIACYASRSIASSCSGSSLPRLFFPASLLHVVTPPWISNFSSGQHLPLSRLLENRSSNFFVQLLDEKIANKQCRFCEIYKNCRNFTVSNLALGSFPERRSAQFSKRSLSNQVRWSSYFFIHASPAMWSFLSFQQFSSILSCCSCTTVHSRKGLKRAGARGIACSSVCACEA